MLLSKLHAYSHLFIFSLLKWKENKWTKPFSKNKLSGIQKSVHIIKIVSQEHDFDTELGYDLMGVEVDEDSDTVVPEEILKLVEEYDNRTTPNVEETETINLGTVETLKEIRIGTHLTCYRKA